MSHPGGDQGKESERVVALVGRKKQGVKKEEGKETVGGRVERVEWRWRQQWGKRRRPGDPRLWGGSGSLGCPLPVECVQEWRGCEGGQLARVGGQGPVVHPGVPENQRRARSPRS